MKLRSVLIQGLVPSLTTKPDNALLSEVLKAQEPFHIFAGEIPSCHPSPLFDRRVILHSGKKLQVNTYNTALLSRREEKQGELLVPMTLIHEGIDVFHDSDLSISVFHHPYNWLESNNATDCRSHIERTSDLVFMGHQHFQHTFTKSNLTGERVKYFEGAQLQDDSNRQNSAFSVFILDLSASRQRAVSFRWISKHYSRTRDSDWERYGRNLVIHSNFRLNPSFASYLSDLGTPFRHQRVGALELG